jgi:hypothetical protein
MLDMYPADFTSMKNGDLSASFRNVYTYLDNNNWLLGFLNSPDTFVTGGFRDRFTRKISLTKTSVIKASKTTRYYSANNFATHTRLCNVTGGLLHYKFVGDIK